ncbi:hypothetical protein BDY24DRAFT_444118 [Mrakia frigida]|uniref:PH domain-containing protein n=1 Tax=Mrakia frigida TaxID=29902 RepID=UPI003FCBF5B9
MSESSHLSRRNACHSTVRRSASTSSFSSSLSSLSTSSNTSLDDNLLYRAPTKKSLYLKATEVNTKALRIEQARERRRVERQKLEEKGEWSTGVVILGSEALEKESWGSRDEIWGTEGKSLADQQFNLPSLTSSSHLHLPPDPTSPLLSNSPLPQFESSNNAASTSRPTLYPLVIPTQPSERPRSLQPLPRILETLESSGSRRHSWTDNIVTGSQLLQLDLDRLKAMGVTAFGTRFRLVESIRKLSPAIVPSPQVVPQPFNFLLTSTHSSPVDSPSIYSAQTLTPTQSNFGTPTQRRPSASIPTPLNITSARRPRRPLPLSPPLPESKPNSKHFQPEIDIQGSLQVRCSRAGRQEERWCMLVRGVGELLIFESRLDPSPIQTISLQGYKIISTFDPPSLSTSSPAETSFTFHLLHRRAPTWYLTATCASSGHCWMKALMKGTVERDYNSNDCLELRSIGHDPASRGPREMQETGVA